MQIKNRSKTEFLSELVLSAGAGALTGAGIMYAGPALAVAGEQAGFEASFLMGTNALTVSTIPDIVTAGGMTLLATDGAYALNEINTMCTGQNLAVDTVFITNPKMAANTNSREFYDQKSGLKIRYDKGVDGENGFEAVDHYHVMNPNYTNKKVDYYLDIDGKPVGKGSKASHIVIKGEE